MGGGDQKRRHVPFWEVNYFISSAKYNPTLEKKGKHPSGGREPSAGNTGENARSLDQRRELTA